MEGKQLGKFGLGPLGRLREPPRTPKGTHGTPLKQSQDDESLHVGDASFFFPDNPIFFELFPITMR